MEIVLYILRWVVSTELDFRSLEMFSRVCRGFFISARDPEIWRLACIRVWGVNCGNCEPKYQSWREMYRQRPRLRYNGCYINKTTYMRHGENSFQDQFYRPWHLVEYYRYLRYLFLFVLTLIKFNHYYFWKIKYNNNSLPQILSRRQSSHANVNWRRPKLRQRTKISGASKYLNPHWSLPPPRGLRDLCPETSSCQGSKCHA